jgi:hypothetical protein
MTKFERAVKEAQKLSPDEQEQLGEDILHYVDKLLALRHEIAIGVEQLDRGETVPGDVVFAKMRARYGG